MKLITCEQCGKQEMRKYNARFCHVCRYKRDNARRRRVPNIKYKSVKQKCAWCGKEFTRTHPRQTTYCSAECSKAAERLNACLAYARRRKCAKK